MQVIFSKNAKDDLAYWKRKDPKKADRIQQLIDAIQKKPFAGIGKPEPLRIEHSGYWSRRIDHEYRLIYKVVKNELYIAQCRYHYT